MFPLSMMIMTISSRNKKRTNSSKAIRKILKKNQERLSKYSRSQNRRKRKEKENKKKRKRKKEKEKDKAVQNQKRKLSKRVNTNQTKNSWQKLDNYSHTE